eukprot:9865158-Karenia_brevis.AAC.1
MKDFTSQDLVNTATPKVALNDFNSQENAGLELLKHQDADHASSVTFDTSHVCSKDFNSHLKEFNPQDLANTCMQYDIHSSGAEDDDADSDAVDNDLGSCGNAQVKDFNSQDIANTSSKMAKRSGMKDFTSQ